MSPQEWLASQKGSAAPVKAMSPEEWLAAQRQREGRPPVVEEEPVFRQVADVPVGMARSFVGGLENVANTYRPDSDAAKSLRGAKEYLGALMSATAKKDEKEQASIELLKNLWLHFNPLRIVPRLRRSGLDFFN